MGTPVAFANCDPRDPPTFESELTYLRRLDLLLPGEETLIETEGAVR
jgi:hypothetical protein